MRFVQYREAGPPRCHRRARQPRRHRRRGGGGGGGAGHADPVVCGVAAALLRRKWHKGMLCVYLCSASRCARVHTQLKNKTRARARAHTEERRVSSPIQRLTSLPGFRLRPAHLGRFMAAPAGSSTTFSTPRPGLSRPAGVWPGPARPVPIRKRLGRAGGGGAVGLGPGISETSLAGVSQYDGTQLR
jgi:hypothetical protein